MSLNLPPAFLQQIRERLGAGLNDFVEALNTSAPVSIRYNTVKGKHLQKPGSRVNWAHEAYYLDQRKSFTADPLFHAGVYYVQEASSMLIEQAYLKAFPIEGPELCIDLCAAPGGKSTHLLTLIDDRGILISNEIHPQRNAVLRQNIARWGYSNSIVTQLPVAGFNKLDASVDLVLIDAPCSGEGLFRKDPDAIDQWSPENVQLCAHRQTDILEKAALLVKEGGHLIYSTCTYNRFENDDQVRKLIDSTNWKVVDLDLEFTGAVRTKYGWQCFPHLVKGEGFYITLLQKISGEVQHLKIRKSKSKPHAVIWDSTINIPDGYLTHRIGNLIHIVPDQHINNMLKLLDILPVKSAGICFGEVKGSDLIPAPELAMANVKLDQIPLIELNKEEALGFLRCDTVLKSECQRGWNLITYLNFHLGWVKVLQGRINNYYPKNWRILKDLDRL